MTQLQCETCAAETPHCQDPEFQKIKNAECWDYSELMPFPVWVEIA